MRDGLQWMFRRGKDGPEVHDRAATAVFDRIECSAASDAEDVLQDAIAIKTSTNRRSVRPKAFMTQSSRRLCLIG